MAFVCQVDSHVPKRFTVIKVALFIGAEMVPHT